MGGVVTKIGWRSLIACSLGALSVCVSAETYAQQSKPLYEAAAGEYLITPGHAVTGRSRGPAVASASLRSHGLTLAKQLGNGTVLVRSSTAPNARLQGPASSQAKVMTNEDDPVCLQLLTSGVAASCSPNYRVKISSTPNDTYRSAMWALDAIDADQGWDLQTGSTDIVVAVIDTGLDYNHPDIVGNVWTNPDEIPANGVDDDNNGYIDDVHGINASRSSMYAGRINGEPMDDNGHGTHVSGTIGAAGNNAVGVVGINWRVKIMPLKFLDRDGGGYLADAVTAINYMVAMKLRGVNIKVSNNSWGGGGYAQTLYQAIQAANDAGILFIAAAGNESNDNDQTPSYPGSYDLPNVISVAAIDNNGNLASFSNYGESEVDIAAPGVGILSLWPHLMHPHNFDTQGYESISGTSMATPHVTGALALLFAQDPSLSSGDARQRLFATGEELETLVGATVTGRLLNVNRLVRNITAPITHEPDGCEYSVQEFPFAPNHAVERSPVVLRADELSFRAVNLPFEFSFFKRATNRLYLSPNGVIYPFAPPASMDNQNGARAPRNSIALLHADLTATRSTDGIRVLAEGDRLHIYYRVRHFFDNHEGVIQVWATLYSNGVIEEQVKFQDGATERFVQTQATIGLAGGATSSALTYAHNSSLIRSGTAIRYTASCGSEQPSPVLSTIDLQGVDNQNRRYGFAVPGHPLRLASNGQGDGIVSLRASIDGVTCSDRINVQLSNGSALLVGRAPGAGTRLAVEYSSSRSSTRTVVRGKIALKRGFGAATSRAVKKATRSTAQSACRSFIRSLRQRA